jgi:hypothetical protein
MSAAVDEHNHAKSESWRGERRFAVFSETSPAGESMTTITASRDAD